ncbi:MAG: phosphodiester glycosidase family protein [Bacteroidales bacterium]|nr:phosphodiester glycosidase family protein [Bacteroidales bacterium]
MHRKLLYLWILFSLLAVSCREDDPESVIPPPNFEEETPPQGKEDDGPHAWDVNRGKEVHPTGAGWTSTTIDNGIIYYTFEGKESVSGANQRIFVVDLDLSNTSYAVKMAYYSSRSTASNVFSVNNAIACMNGGYEMGSIFVQVDGVNKSMMPNNTISDTGVYNWKSEACVFLEGDRDVQIQFSGKDMNVNQQRTYYRSISSKHKSMLTSAPMLIDDYEPVGESFYIRYSPASSTSSEDPYNHQEKNRHPRTVLAKTEFNHLLFIVIDGRRNVSDGMRAREVTRFLVNNFNPQYAINLDGGGSSTLCVKGQGDPTTHVVNYPTDSDKVDPRPGAGDHTGERSVPTFFYIVKK